MRKEAAAEKEARRSACLRYPPRAHDDVEHSSVSGRDAAFLIHCAWIQTSRGSSCMETAFTPRELGRPVVAAGI
jgi:hypothetical protein